MNPYQPGEDNQEPYTVGHKAGAASRDAEVVSLTNQRDYEYVRAENAEQERDQLREQVKMLRDAIKYSKHQCESIRTWGGMSWVYHPLQAGRIFNRCEEALAATEPKP